jgi:hypothetical protein
MWASSVCKKLSNVSGFLISDIVKHSRSVGVTPRSSVRQIPRPAHVENVLHFRFARSNYTPRLLLLLNAVSPCLPRRQIELGNLLFGQRDPLQSSCRRYLIVFGISTQTDPNLLLESRQMGRGGEGCRPEAGIVRPAHRRQRCVKKFTDAPGDVC